MFNNERISNLEEKVNYLNKRVGLIEEELETIEPDNRWRHDNKYLSSYCPKCKANNRSQVPMKAKNSMKFICDNCDSEYRIFFDNEGGE